MLLYSIPKKASYIVYPFIFVFTVYQTAYVIVLYSAQANIGDDDDVYSFDERRIYNDQDLSDLVSIACEVLGGSVTIFLASYDRPN